MTKYAILQQDNTPIAASSAAVKAHIEAELGGQHPVSVIRQWTEAYRNEMGVYTIVEIKAALLDYQTHQAQPLVLAGGTVMQTYVAADIELDAAKEQAKTALASKRYDAETGGITVINVHIQTDRESRSNLIAARTLAKEDATYSTYWKTADGSFMKLDAETIIAIAYAVVEHVEKCFRDEMQLAAQIDAATTLEELRAIEI